MAGTNDIQTFGLDPAANVLTQSAYVALTARLLGFQSGTASSAQVNKVLRQAAFMARVLSQWAVDTSGGTILDNGDEANAKGLLTSSINALINVAFANSGYATTATLNSDFSALQAAINAEISNRVTAVSNVQGQLPNYMSRYVSSGASVRQVITPTTPNQLIQNTLSFTAATGGYLMLIGSVNIGSASPTTPGGATHQLFVDSSVVNLDSTYGPMTNVWCGVIPQGAHSFAQQFITGSSNGPYASTGLNFAYQFIGS